MKRTGRKALTWLVTLAMLVSLASGMAVSAWAAEAQAPELSMWSPTDVTVTGADGQEYVIAPKGSEPDWSKAVEPKDGFVTFEDLTPAGTYVIYTRLKDGTGEPLTKELTLDLAGLGVSSPDDYVPGAVLTVEPDPEDTQGLTYQWYCDEITVNEYGGEEHSFTPIEGAAAATYTIKEADLGKYLAVKAFKGEAEVGDITWLGPVSETGVPALPGGAEDCPRDDACPISQFTDASPNAWYHDGVHWALEYGLMNGTGETTFAPNGTATRAMVVTMLWRLAGEPEAKSAASFTDVSAGAWYADAVNWAAETGAVTGTSADTFSPNAPVTREQLVTILYRYADSKGAAESPDANILDYDDALDVSSWAVLPFRWAVQEGIITGVGNNRLAPGDNATRAQVATMFQRFCGVLEAAAGEAASDDWSCFGTFDNDDGHAINIDLLTDDGYPVTLTLKGDGDYTGYLHKEGPELYGGLQNEAGKYVTVTVSYDGEKTVSVLFEDAEDSPAVKTGDRIDLLP